MSTEEPNEPRSLSRAALWIAVAGFTVIAGAWISIPGVDGEALAAGSPSLLGLFDVAAPVAPVIGLSVALLVLVRIVLGIVGKTESRRARVIALAIYLGLTAVQLFTIAVWAESTYLPFGELVPEPGFRFRLTAMITGVAGAAIVWWLADRIDATRAATGALAIAMVAACMTLVHRAGAVGASVSTGETTPLGAAVVLALPFGCGIAAIALALRTPSRWPVVLAGKLALRSSFDVLAVPFALAVLIDSGGPLSFVAPPVVSWIVIACGSVALAVVVRRRSPDPAPRRALWPLGVALATFVIAIAPIALSATTSGALSRALEPGPLEGEASFTITLAAVGSFRADEPEAMVERLDSLGAGASIVSSDAHRITLRVEHARDVESVLDALRPHTIALHLVIDPPSGALPDGARLAPSYRHAVEGPCDVLRAFDAGCTSAIEVAPESECVLYCLDPTPVITTNDVTDARVIRDPYAGLPVVAVTFDENAGRRFERVTGANVHRQLAIVVDGEVRSAPVIQSAIAGGRAQISLGTGSADELFSQANVLAAALMSPHPITSEWTYESVDR